jgi:hypothetical protein
MSSGDRSLRGRGDLATSLLMIFPLVLVYEVGVMFSSSVNGADFVTRWVLAAVGYDRTRYLAVHLALAALFVIALIALRRRRRFEPREIAPMLIESSIYALTIGSLLVFAVQGILGLSWGLPASVEARLVAFELGETGEAVIASVGAGVHEELVFRLGLFAGGAAVLVALGVSRTLALLAAGLIAAALFSAAHHIGPLGDPFEIGIFAYRLLAGVVFALLFYYRSLAHAVYTHFLYDLYVLVLR